MFRCGLHPLRLRQYSLSTRGPRLSGLPFFLTFFWCEFFFYLRIHGCDRDNENNTPDVQSDGHGIRATTSDNFTESMTSYENATAHVVTPEDEAHTMKLLQVAGSLHKHPRKLSSQGEEEENDDGSESEDGDGVKESSDESSDDSTEAEESSDHQVSTKTTVRAASPQAEQAVSAGGLGENGMGAPASRHAYMNVTHLSMMLLKIIKTYVSNRLCHFR